MHFDVNVHYEDGTQTQTCADTLLSATGLLNASIGLLHVTRVEIVKVGA